MEPKYIMPVKILKGNQGPKCESTLVLEETTYSVASLDERGMATFCSLDEEVELKLVCTGCGERYDVEKGGPYFQIKRTTKPIPKMKPIVKEFNPFYNT